MAEPSSSDQALVEEALNHGFARLRFVQPLELAFVRTHAEARTAKLMLAGLVSIVVFNALLLSDFLVSPGQFHVALILRLGVYAPLVLISLIVLHRLSMPQINEWAVVPLACLACEIVLHLACINRGELAFTRIIELIIIVIFAAVFSRFWPIVTLSVVTILTNLFVSAVFPGLFQSLRLGSLLLLLTTIAFALYACYTRERHARMSFLLDLREQGLRQSIHAANQQLAEMVRTDALTGVPNRRAFDDALAKHIAQSPQHELALLLVDVDHFKSFNDRYGHQEGDRCLCEIARAISSCLRRPVDMLARWGGEEFAVLLSGASEDVARHVAQRICTTVEQSVMPNLLASSGSPVTVSIGVSLSTASARCEAQSLLNLADGALYRAKHLGRNRVVMA